MVLACVRRTISTEIYDTFTTPPTPLGQESTTRVKEGRGGVPETPNLYHYCCGKASKALFCVSSDPLSSLPPENNELLVPTPQLLVLRTSQLRPSIRHACRMYPCKHTSPVRSISVRRVPALHPISKVVLFSSAGTSFSKAVAAATSVHIRSGSSHGFPNIVNRSLVNHVCELCLHEFLAEL